MVVAALGAPATSAAQDGEVLRNPAHYVAMPRERGMLAPALKSQVQRVASVLVRQADQWAKAQVNGTYDPNGLNIYVLDLAAPEAEPIPGLSGTLKAYPPQKIVLADAAYLAQIKAATEIYMASVRSHDRSVHASDTLVFTLTQGPDKALRSRFGVDADWRRDTNELFDGAVAFLIAHEMGHLMAGLDPALQGWVSLPPGLEGRDRDRFWACENLMGKAVAGKRREEADADKYAVRLLGGIPHPATQPQRLLYEHGTFFLMNAELGKLTSALFSLLPNGPELAAQWRVRVNPITVRAMAGRFGRDDGFVQIVFPDSHPALADRLLDVMDMFARNPGSSYYGDQDFAHDRETWRNIIEDSCQGIGTNR